MTTIATRLTNAGTLLINGRFDEQTSVNPSNFRLASDTLYVSELDEITIQGGSVAQSQLNTGVLQVREIFDEITGAPVVDSSLSLWIDGAQTSSYSGTGSTWTDISPNAASSFSLQGSPTFNSYDRGGSISFNGTNQYGVGSGSPVKTTEYTKSVWFKLDAVADNNLLSSDGGGHFMFLAGTSNIYCGHSDWGNYFVYPSNATFDLDTWYNVCLTFDTISGMTLYVNGVQDSVYTTQKTAVPGTGQCNLGCFGPAGNLLNGSIGQAMIYKRVLSTDEVAQNFNALRRRYQI